ncbi:MAG: V-type ATPase subunit [Oscillospiraceae bacterium]|nr:V-type ATPase subunit [Candidatus Equicaccousia limihippi]
MANKVGGAVYAKIRTRFGERLSASQYLAMSGLHSVGEVAEYLKNTKRYKAIFRESSGNIHRGFLEKLIKKQANDDILGLCAYERNTEKVLSDILSERLEIDQLLLFIRYFLAGQPKEYALNVSYTVDKISKIDLLKLSDITSVEELRNALKGTDYYKWLGTVLTKDDISFSQIESVLYKAHFAKSYAILQKDGKGEKAAQIIARTCEINDISLIYRIKKYYPSDSGLLAYAHKIPDKLKKDEYDRLLKAATFEEFSEILKSTAYGNIENFTAKNALSNAREALVKQMVKNIHFSSDAPTVLLSYAYYCEAEVRDVTHIIEGVRYGLSSDEILRKLELYNIIRGENDG